MYPLISVIIPTKNEEKNITRCLQSIKNQDYKGKTEIIVVDNHSNDKTVALAKRFTPHVFIAGNERASQRNIGAKKAKGQWLLFIDADMELSKNVVEECVNLTKNQIMSPIITITENAEGKTFWGKALALEKNCYRYTYWLQAARFFHRNYFVKLGGYDETLVAGEDWDITQRFRDAGLPSLYTKRSYLIHHEPDLSLSRLLRKEIFYISHINKYAIKHPLYFSYQGSFLYRIFLWARSWYELIHHPVLTSSFILYKFIVWLFWKRYRKNLQNQNQ